MPAIPVNAYLLSDLTLSSRRRILPSSSVFTELKRVGFDGWISIEDGVYGIDQLRRSTDFLRRKTAAYWEPLP